MNTRLPVLFAPLFVLLAACSRDEPDAGVAQIVFADEPAPEPATAEEAARVVVRVPSAAARDYFVTPQTVRVMAVEPGDDTSGRFAIVSDVDTWSTKTMRPGDSFGRGFSVRSIGEDSVVFPAAPCTETRAVLERDTRLTKIEHRFDRAARYRGRGRFVLAPAVARQAFEARGAGIDTTPIDALSEPGVRITVTDASLASALGLRTEDILLTVDGESVTESNAPSLLAKTTTTTVPVVVRAYRSGSLHTWTYQPR